MAGRGESRIGGDRLREPGVHPATLTGQQVLVHRFANKRVPERITLGVGQQHVGGDRRPQRVLEVVIAEPARRTQQRMPGAVTGGAGDPQHVLGLVGQPLHPGEDQVTQRLGQVVVTAHQFLDEQRIALAAREHPVHPCRFRLTAEDRREELRRFAAGQPGQIGPLHPGQPGELGQQRPQRVGAVQLVGAERADDQHPRQRPLVADQERQQIPGRAVGPVQILDEQHDRPALAELLKQRQHLLEQPAASFTWVGGCASGRRLALLRLGSSEVRQQPRHLTCPPAEQLDDARRACLPRQLPQHGSKRRERQAVNAKLQAATGQHPPTLGVNLPGELSSEPGFPDPGLATEQHRNRLAAPGGRVRSRKVGKLHTAANEDRADETGGHAFQHAIAAVHRNGRSRGGKPGALRPASRHGGAQPPYPCWPADPPGLLCLADQLRDLRLLAHVGGPRRHQCLQEIRLHRDRLPAGAAGPPAQHRRSP